MYFYEGILQLGIGLHKSSSKRRHLPLILIHCYPVINGILRQNLNKEITVMISLAEAGFVRTTLKGYNSSTFIHIIGLLDDKHDLGPVIFFSEFLLPKKCNIELIAN